MVTSMMNTMWLIIVTVTSLLSASTTWTNDDSPCNIMVIDWIMMRSIQTTMVATVGNTWLMMSSMIWRRDSMMVAIKRGCMCNSMMRGCICNSMSRLMCNMMRISVYWSVTVIIVLQATMTKTSLSSCAVSAD